MWRSLSVFPLGAAMILALPLRAQAPQFHFEKFRLDNGLTVILHEDHSVPLVTVVLSYHVGSKNERPGRTGFAHLFEHMLFQGSEHVGDDEHFRLVQGAGGALNGSTWFDRTNYWETVPASFLELALWLESDRMGFFLPGITQGKLDNQREVVKNERRWRYENQPYGLWLETILELVYPKDFPYHWPVIGYMQDLNAAELDDVKEFFSTYYAPNNAVLSIAGDLNPQETRRLVERYFGPIPRGPDISPVTTSFSGALGGERRKVIPDRVQLPRVYHAYPIPAYGEPGWYRAALLVDLLTEGKASRLYRALVYEQQIAQAVEGLVYETEETSLLILHATARPGVTPTHLETALQAELDRLIQWGPADLELRRTKNQRTRWWLEQVERLRGVPRIGGRADLMAKFETYFGDPGRINTELDRFLEPGVETLQQAARQLLGRDNRAVVVFVPQTASD